MNNLDWQWPWTEDYISMLMAKPRGDHSWRTFSFIHYKTWIDSGGHDRSLHLYVDGKDKGVVAPDILCLLFTIMNNLDRQWWPQQKSAPLCWWQGWRGGRSWHTLSFIHYSITIMNNLDWQRRPRQKSTPLCEWGGTRGYRSWHTFHWLNITNNLDWQR